MFNLRLLFVLLVSYGLVACDQPAQKLAPQPKSMPEVNAEPPSAKALQFSQQLTSQLYTDVSAAYEKAQELDSAIAAFLQIPEQKSLDSAQQAWRSAYDAFLVTLLYSKLNLLDSYDWEKQGTIYAHLLDYLDSWPIEGGYIDHVPGHPFSGIVNDLTLPINARSLLNQHGFTDPSYASLGFHVLEFMLWGQDGNRAVSDFLPLNNTTSSFAHDLDRSFMTEIHIQNQHRRRQFLQLVSEQLLTHLSLIAERWHPNSGYYAQQLNNLPAERFLQVGLQAMQELINDDLLAKRIVEQSSEFSNTGWQDINILIESVRSLAVGGGLIDAEQEDWQSLATRLEKCSEATQENCQEALQELLALLTSEH